MDYADFYKNTKTMVNYLLSKKAYQNALDVVDAVEDQMAPDDFWYLFNKVLKSRDRKKTPIYFNGSII